MGAGADILIVVEGIAASVPASAHELIAAAAPVVRQSGTARLCALLLAADGDTQTQAQELIARGVDRVYMATIAGLGELTVEARLPVIEAVCRELAPRLVLFVHDLAGAELAPRLAFRLDGAAATGCMDIAIVGDTLACTRPCYGGVAREIDRFEAAPLVATVRTGVFAPPEREAGRTGDIVAWASPSAAPARTRLIGRTIDAADGVRLDDARTIVAGGRGLQGPEGFGVLATLAQALGGAVGASRVPCDLGWCPHSWQIGLTGKTVTPELYIAVGISGAGHHMAGCGNAKTIVAINTDPEAGIFQDARFGVVGDYREVVPALTAELGRLRQARAALSSGVDHGV